MSELTLVLEATTGTASVALVRDLEVIAEASVPMRGPDGERLMPTVVQLLQDAAVRTTDLGRIICSNGPGGFTSLRIAAAIGKGLAESLGVPLWSASSLGVLAVGALGGDGERLSRELGSIGGAAGTTAGPLSGRPASKGAPDVIAVLDAMRNEWYARQFAYDPSIGVAVRGEARLVGREALAEWAATSGALVVGAGGETFDGGHEAVPQARDVVRLPEGDLLHAVDLADWEPDYGRLAEAQVKWEQTHRRPLGPVE
jgi:tRNA threonylcarbamoyladenosine biosynthesis protein TsaB